MLRVALTIIFISFISAAHAHSTNECLASAIFYEANLEPLEGKVAVAEVIENRAKAYNMTVCQVVKQKGQFTFVSETTRWLSYEESRKVLNKLGSRKKVFDHCMMYFHNIDVKPRWTKEMIKVDVIGRHIFYKDRRCGGTRRFQK